MKNKSIKIDVRNLKVKVSVRYLKALRTQIRNLQGELKRQSRIIYFVKRFNPRLFYRTPKDLIPLLKSFQEELMEK